MGWYLRKSLNLGPIRINLSKSGIGVSAGVKGLRVGTGPRGKYLHAGREGIYYRTSLDSEAERTAATRVQEVANADVDPALKNVTEFHGASDEQLAAARWARITAQAEGLGNARSDPERGFFSSLIRNFFGGLLRGR
jgi:hypothetical protein